MTTRYFSWYLSKDLVSVTRRSCSQEFWTANPARARHQSPFTAAHGTRPSKRSIQPCLTTPTSRNSTPPMPARPPPSPCRPVPFARADSWSSRAVPPRYVSGEIAPSRDEAIGWREFLSPRRRSCLPLQEGWRGIARRNDTVVPARNRNRRNGGDPRVADARRRRFPSARSRRQARVFRGARSPVRCGKNHRRRSSRPQVAAYAPRDAR